MSLGNPALGSAPLAGTGVSAFLAAGLQVLIGTQDVTDMIQWPSAHIEQELSGRAQFDCQLKNTVNYRPKLGEVVAVWWRGGLIFQGLVYERDIEFLYTKPIGLLIDVRAVDFNALADRRYAGEVFEQLPAGEIVKLLAFKYLAVEGVLIGNVHQGPNVVKVVFPRQPLAKCFDSLCERSGFYWTIDVNRFINFFPRDFTPAPFTITSANAVFKSHSMKSSKTLSQYRNVEYVDGGKGITEFLTEPFRGDRTRKSFTTEYKIAKQPTITLNGLPQSVGIRGVDEGKQWYWAKGENSIGQDNSGATLFEPDLLLVTYQGEYKLTQVVADTAAIAARKAIEGGSGRYEHLIQDTTLEGQDLVEEKGLASLRRFGTLDDVVKFDVDIEGLAIGQSVPVDVPEHELLGEFLIIQMESQWLRGDTRRFTVTATTGEIKNKYQDFFARLLAEKQPITISEGEILQEVDALHDFASVGDSITADLVPVSTDEFGTGEAGTAEFGA